MSVLYSVVASENDLRVVDSSLTILNSILMSVLQEEMLDVLA